MHPLLIEFKLFVVNFRYSCILNILNENLGWVIKLASPFVVSSLYSLLIIVKLHCLEIWTQDVLKKS